jgi:hypothetical protein
MLKSVNGIIGTMMLGAIALISPSGVSADQISLTLKAQNFTVVGQYVGFAEGAYIIMTENGEMRVPAAMVSCEGTACDAAPSDMIADS